MRLDCADKGLVLEEEEEGPRGLRLIAEETGTGRVVVLLYVLCEGGVEVGLLRDETGFSAVVLYEPLDSKVAVGGR